MTFLLDTCAAIWIARGDRIATAAQTALNHAVRMKQDVHLSPITAWEVGQLSARGRIALGMEPLRWWQRFLATSGAKQADLGPELLIAASYLPDFDHRDPCDRIIVATAREHGYCIVTRDRRILAYAERGFCRALAC